MPTSEARRQKREARRREKKAAAAAQARSIDAAPTGPIGHGHSHGRPSGGELERALGAAAPSGEQETKQQDLTPEEIEQQRATLLKTAKLHKGKGDLLMKMDKPQEALLSYEEGLQAASQADDRIVGGEICSDMSLALLSIGQWDLAMNVAMQAVAMRPLWPQAMYQLGETVRFRGAWEVAADCYRQALQKDPSDQSSSARLREIEAIQQLARSPAHQGHTLPIVGAVGGVALCAALAYVDSANEKPTMDNPLILSLMLVIFGAIGAGVGFLFRWRAEEARLRRLEPPANVWAKENGLELPFPSPSSAGSIEGSGAATQRLGARGSEAALGESSGGGNTAAIEAEPVRKGDAAARRRGKKKKALRNRKV